jgi:hypothetical protein
MTKVDIDLMKGKLSEREVREKIDIAAERARRFDQMAGKTDKGQEHARREMTEKAQRDHNKGEI